ncbi:MAG: hypothetical protein EOS01_36770, partial [Mesorhizobium sp.]
PVTSPQSPVTSHESRLTSSQSPVTSRTGIGISRVDVVLVVVSYFVCSRGIGAPSPVSTKLLLGSLRSPRAFSSLHRQWQNDSWVMG